MIEIDGSHGEGGGQILRTAISLSAVRQEPVKIWNVRAGRPNPGLSAQHVTSIEAVAELCDAEVDGLFQGSKEITFRPGQIVGGDFEFDVGTAGSVSLIIQSCLLPAATSKTTVKLTVRGGTDVRWSPPMDYLTLVHMPMAKMFGVAFDTEIISRGFYPEGGGEVAVEISPASRLTGAQIPSPGQVRRIEGVAFAQNLPDHVLTRMKHAAMKQLVGFKEVKIDSNLSKGRSTGAGIVLASVCENTVLGQSALGEKGVRAEALGEGCAHDLMETVRSGAAVDEHMLDQILPYMALADEPSLATAEEMTGHAQTNIWVLEKFVGRRFDVKNAGNLVEVRTY
jgi:RNA 3'-phosphate cyclase